MGGREEMRDWMAAIVNLPFGESMPSAEVPQCAQIIKDINYECTCFFGASLSKLSLKSGDQEMLVDFDRLSPAVCVSCFGCWLVSHCWFRVAALHLFKKTKQKTKHFCINSAHRAPLRRWAEFICEWVRLELLPIISSHFSWSTALLISVWFKHCSFNSGDYAHLSPGSHDFTLTYASYHTHTFLVNEIRSAPFHSPTLWAPPAQESNWGSEFDFTSLTTVAPPQHELDVCYIARLCLALI